MDGDEPHPAHPQKGKQNPHGAGVRMEDVGLHFFDNAAQAAEQTQQTEGIPPRCRNAQLPDPGGFQTVRNPPARGKNGHVLPARAQSRRQHLHVRLRPAALQPVGQ